MKRVLKWNVPVDDREHPIGAGPVMHVACQSTIDVVQVWTLEDDHVREVVAARVFATGQPLPEGVGADHHLGSVLIWHVFRVTGG